MNKSSCSVVVSSQLFGDPCPGTAKYLEVQYHCVKGKPKCPRARVFAWHEQTLCVVFTLKESSFSEYLECYTFLITFSLPQAEHLCLLEDHPNSRWTSLKCPKTAALSITQFRQEYRPQHKHLHCRRPLLRPSSVQKRMMRTPLMRLLHQVLHQPVRSAYHGRPTRVIMPWW